MSQHDCHRYELCCAPICPLDEDRAEAMWYPIEDICSSHKISPKPIWILNQRKIARKCPNGKKEYFVLTMLDRRIIIKKGIRGLSPEVNHDSQLKNWLKRHPELSQKLIKSLQKRGQNLRTWQYTRSNLSENGD